MLGSLKSPMSRWSCHPPISYFKDACRFASGVREILRAEDLSSLMKAGKPVLVDFTASYHGTPTLRTSSSPSQLVWAL